MPTRAGHRVLIVEDGSDDRMVYRVMLTRQTTHALAVTLATTGEEGLRALRGGGFDCLLLDHDLPDMTGLEMLDQLAPAGGPPPCAVVMVTGSRDERLPGEARRRGVAAVLLKDEVEAPALREAIAAAIAAAPGAGGGVALSLAEARRGLAATFGVRPADVEIIIHG